MTGDSALVRRIITAVIGAAIVVAAVFGLPATGVGVLAGLVALAGGWEWGRLVGLRSLPSRSLYLLILAVLASSIWVLAGVAGARWLLAAAVLWWVAVAVWLLAGGRAARNPRPVRTTWLLAGLLLLPALASGLTLLALIDGHGRWILLYSICLVWVADIGAYFTGRAFGRRKLAPSVSAGKTWEGLVGGSVAVGIYAAFGGWALDLAVSMLGFWVLLALLAAGASVVGDLFESVLKREAGVKDSGRILPGHGGVLDRVDSLMAAIPILALGLHELPLLPLS